MPNLLLIAGENDIIKKLPQEITRAGFTCARARNGESLAKCGTEPLPDVVLLAADSVADIRELSHKIKYQNSLPVIALICQEMLDSLDTDLEIDDFIVMPCDVAEVVLRAKKLLPRTNHRDSGGVITCADLIIDSARCEVTLAGRRIVLTFREYELLRFLAGNRGRVFTREALLDRVWGYDYYGGDRTVDVHIRRLRSKTEDATHTFIETVRNIGYRFRTDIP